MNKYVGYQILLILLALWGNKTTIVVVGWPMLHNQIYSQLIALVQIVKNLR